jgi:hypothetical protein
MAESLGAEADRWCIVLVVVERDGSLVLVVEPTRVAVPCPHCGELSRRQHSRYERHPLDLPWRGQTVRMRVHSRRWFCDTYAYVPPEDFRRTLRRRPGSLCAPNRRHHRSADDVRAAGRRRGRRSTGPKGWRADQPGYAPADPAYAHGC